MAKRAKIIYPSRIEVEPGVWISTGPYRKEVCGNTQEEVNSYLRYLKNRYDTEKYDEIQRNIKMLEALKNQNEAIV